MSVVFPDSNSACEESVGALDHFTRDHQSVVYNVYLLPNQFEPTNAVPTVASSQLSQGTNRNAERNCGNRTHLIHKSWSCYKELTFYLCNHEYMHGYGCVYSHYVLVHSWRALSFPLQD